AEIFLEFRIELYVRRIIQKQIELNLFVSWPFKQSRIQCVRLRRNHLRICYAVGVLPARPARSQNALAEYVAILCCRRCPIFSDRAPSFTKAFFVGVPILRNNGGNSFRVRHCQSEAGWRAIIEHVNCVAVDLERLRESVDRERKSIEGVRIFSFRRHFRESETRKVRRDHSVIASQARNEFAEHERRSWES